MYSKKLENLISKLPDERGAIERLNELIESKLQNGGGATSPIFSVTRLFDLVKPTSSSSFSSILTMFEQEGIIEKVVRVESPRTKAGIQDFPSIMDVPSVLHDPYQDMDLEIKPEDLKLLYRFINKDWNEDNS